MLDPRHTIDKLHTMHCKKNKNLALLNDPSR